jgi:signal transduction histidine kinase
MYGFQEQTAQLRDREYAGALLLGRMRSVHDELAQNAEYLTLFPSDTVQRLFLDALSTLARQTDTLHRLVGGARAMRLRSAMSRLADQGPRAHNLYRSGRVAAADSVVDLAMRAALADIEREIQNSELAVEERTTERVQEFAERTADAAYMAAAALAIVLLLALVIAVWLTRSISAPLKELDAGMRAVSEGQFERRLRISRQRRDEFGRLADSYQSMATQLQELDRLRAEFLSVASHELKTPLNVMLGYLQLLQEDVYGDLNQRQREILATLTAQTQLLSRLVRQLLDISRFDAGGGKLDVRPVVLDEFLQDLERAFRVLALQRQVEFDVRREQAIPYEVYWDPERVNEVLGNLLSNAFKFTSRGGRVALYVARDGEHVSMRVSDSGAGIPPDQLHRIFEKFFQADTETPTGLRGAGLGLAIAKSIVTAHGGTIDVHSRVGAGTTFTIRLPVRVIRRITPSVAEPEEAA